jgi:N-glycosylase/DNA lyase
MDYSKLESFEKGIILKDIKNFELSHIFDCGQCFRWNRQENGNYIGVAYGKVIEIEKKHKDVIIYNTDEKEFHEIWKDYFDLERDYLKIKEALSEDNLLKVSVEFGHGIRLLQQEPFELVISFIISSNNRIPMIKRAITNISEKFGNNINYKGKTYYAFPTLEQLSKATVDDLTGCSTGFRAKYIADTVEKIQEAQINKNINKFDLNWIRTQNDDNCHDALQIFNGVGPKVADCVMLFSMSKYSAFPVDVWVKRAMQHFYLAPDVSLKKIRDFARNKFGELSGFAQQYLFYYARENNIKVE